MIRYVVTVLAAVLTIGCVSEPIHEASPVTRQRFQSESTRVLLSEHLAASAEEREVVRIDVHALPQSLHRIAYPRLQALFGTLGFRVIETRSQEQLDEVLLEQQGLAYDESQALRLGRRTPAPLLVTFNLNLRGLQPVASSLERRNFYEATGVLLQVTNVVTGEVLASLTNARIVSTVQVSEEEILTYALDELERALLEEL